MVSLETPIDAQSTITVLTVVYIVVCFLLGNSPASEFQKFRLRGITQKKTYNIRNMAKVWNQVVYIVVCFLLGNSPASEFQKFRLRGITQKKTYNIQNMAKVWNQVVYILFFIVLATVSTLSCFHFFSVGGILLGKWDSICLSTMSPSWWPDSPRCTEYFTNKPSTKSTLKFRWLNILFYILPMKQHR